MFLLCSPPPPHTHHHPSSNIIQVKLILRIMNKVIWVAGVSCWINIILILRCKYVRSPDKHSSEWKKMSVICICWTIIWQYWCVCACACMLYLHWDRRLNVFSVRQQTSKHNSADTTRFHWYCCFFSENRSCQPCVWVFVCVCVSVRQDISKYNFTDLPSCQRSCHSARQRKSRLCFSENLLWLCVDLCVCECSRGRPDNETRHVCHLLRCLFFGFCNPGWKTHLSPFRHRCLQSRDDVHACAG